MLGAALAVLVVGAALAGTPARASAESGEAAGAETVTTVLQPGWNMVGWLGPEAPVTDLFEAIPALELVSAWDAAEQRYRRRGRNSIPRYALEVVAPGMGLWLKLGGDLPFQWTRPASATSVLLSLQAGRNLVGWAGRDETAIDEATSRFARFAGPYLAVGCKDASVQAVPPRRRVSIARVIDPRVATVIGPPGTPVGGLISVSV